MKCVFSVSKTELSKNSKDYVGILVGSSGPGIAKNLPRTPNFGAAKMTNANNFWHRAVLAFKFWEKGEERKRKRKRGEKEGKEVFVTQEVRSEWSIGPRLAQDFPIWPDLASIARSIGFLPRQFSGSFVQPLPKTGPVIYQMLCQKCLGKKKSCQKCLQPRFSEMPRTPKIFACGAFH